MTAPKPVDQHPSPDAIAAFLRANPGWLADNPELYRILTPPARVYGEALADHMAAMVQAGRAHAAAASRHADGVLAAGRASAGLTGRVQDAVVTLIRASHPADCVSHALPGILAVDAAALCMEDWRPGARPLPLGTVARLLDGRDVIFRDAPSDAALLHGEAAPLARYDALVRVPGPGPDALIALAARDRATLDPAQGTGGLAFLGRAIAALMGR